MLMSAGWLPLRTTLPQDAQQCFVYSYVLVADLYVMKAPYGSLRDMEEAGSPEQHLWEAYV